MKKRFLLIGAATVLVMAAVAGGSLAASQASGDQKLTADLVATNLKIQLESGELAQPQAVDLKAEKAVMPGDDIKLYTGEKQGVYAVQNAGGVACYVRVTVNKYWTRNGEKQMDLNAANLTARLFDTENWLESSTEALFGENAASETQVFYYKKPVAVGDGTSSLLGSLQLAKNMGNEYAGLGIQLEAVADGVQFAGADYNTVNQDAILSSWGVLAQLDGGGNILSIEQ